MLYIPGMKKCIMQVYRIAREMLFLFFLGMQLKDLTVGYAYNMFTSKIGALSGSHDIFVNYSMNMNFMGKSKNKHKSIRIL